MVRATVTPLFSFDWRQAKDLLIVQMLSLLLEALRAETLLLRVTAAFQRNWFDGSG
jgi:hypothetical protein